MVQPHTNTVERNTQARALLKKSQNEIRKFDAIADAIADSIRNKKGKGALKQCKEMKKCADVMIDLTNKTAANVDRANNPSDVNTNVKSHKKFMIIWTTDVRKKRERIKTRCAKVSKITGR